VMSAIRQPDRTMISGEKRERTGSADMNAILSGKGGRN
jgi:hypothetical protein